MSINTVIKNLTSLRNYDHHPALHTTNKIESQETILQNKQN